MMTKKGTETWGYHRCNCMPENLIDPEKGPGPKNENVKPRKEWSKVKVQSGTRCEHCNTISRFVEP